MPIERKSTGDDPIATTAKTKARLEVRQAKLKDVPEIAELVRRAYADLPPYTLGEIRGQLNNYREGCFVAKLDGEIVGYLSSGAYGHHLGGAMGLGYVPCVGESAEQVLASSYEVDVAGVRVKAEASLKPMYDPKSERVKA